MSQDRIRALREFTNEGGESVVVAVADDGMNAVEVSIVGPHTQGEWTITPREAAQLHSALDEYFARQNDKG